MSDTISGNNNPEYISLTEAAEGTPYSQEYLSLLARKGKLPSQKIGRNWYTTRLAVAEYIEQQKKQLLAEIKEKEITDILRNDIISEEKNGNASARRHTFGPISNLVRYSIEIGFTVMIFFMLGVFAMNYSSIGSLENALKKSSRDLEQFAAVVEEQTGFLDILKRRTQQIADSVYEKITGIKIIVKEKTQSTEIPEHEKIKTQEQIIKKVFLPREAKPQEETIRIHEVIEHQEKIIPADVTLVKQSILTEVENINKSLRERFENALNDLTLKLSRTTVSTDSNTRIITLTQKIDQLSNATFSNATFQGTANQFNLRDTDIPDDITVTGSISPSQLTVSNTLTVQGTGTSTYSGGIQAKALNLTSTTATSTFSNGIQLGGGCFKNSQGDCLTSTSPGGSNSQIQFNSSGTFSADSNLIWDNTLKRFGIGTSTPGSLLSIQGNSLTSGTSTVNSIIATSTLFVGSSGQLFNVFQNGNVGIGTTSPSSLLSVQGNTLISGTSTVNSLIATSTLFIGSIGQFFNVLQSGFVGIGTTSPSSLFSVHGNTLISGTTTSNSLIATSTLFVGSNGNLLNVMQNGFVGIGTTSPGSLLSVQAGNVQITGTTTVHSLIATSTLLVGSNILNPNLLILQTGSTTIAGPLNIGSIGTSTFTGALLIASTTATSTFVAGLNVGTLNVSSTTATSTFGNGIQLSNGCYRSPTGGCLKEVVTIRKTSDETVNNSTTLQNDDELFLAMAANETWFFTAHIAYVSNATADFKPTFTVPAGASIRWNCTGARIAVDDTVVDCTSITTSGQTRNVHGSTDEIGIDLVGTVVNGGTAGNLQFQWAQDVATAVDTKVLTNSYLEAHK